MENIKDTNPLGTEDISKLLFRFAGPAVVALLVNSLYNIVDQIFIGKGVGPSGIAATQVSFPIVTIVLSLSMLIGAGSAAYASIKLGEKKFEVAEITLCNSFVLLIAVGILIMVFGIIFIEPMLWVFGAREQIMEITKDYSLIILMGVPFMMIGAGMSNLARTDGSPKISMISMLIGAALNTILDPIYIFVLGLGVKGAAIATITSQILSAIVLIWYFAKKGNMRFKRRYMKLDFIVIKGFTALGISSCITQLANTVLQIILNNSLMFYGEQSEVGGVIAQSAMGVVMKVSAILIAINIGIGTGAQPILGYNRGAENYKRIKSTYLLSVKYATAVSIIGWILCIWQPKIILSIFGTGDSNFMDFAVLCMKIFMAGVFCSGFQIVSTGYFQATGQALKASVLSMLRQVILLLPLLIIFPIFFGLNGIIYAGPVADILSALTVGIFIIIEMKSLNKKIAESN